jgi:hypothetical protein
MANGDIDTDQKTYLSNSVILLYIGYIKIMSVTSLISLHPFGDKNLKFSSPQQIARNEQDTRISFK